MKKILMIIITSIILVISSSPVYSLGYEDLGDFRDAYIFHIYDGWGMYPVSILTFQFGIIIRGVSGGDIMYFYGEEDLPGLAKKSYEVAENNYNGLIQVDVYEANNLNNPVSIENKIVNRNSNYNLENLNLNLVDNKLYIIVFRDERGVVLDIKKIVKMN
ncbi:MAG: hypothetical protein KC414_01485 [Romboutsia sp.]|nr:hypothetical protein [Romboutsia sp.]MCB0702503.1 hypothetical protein [Ignavibacteriota bacterium]